jgi:very-short-patch-repair endonuclease
MKMGRQKKKTFNEDYICKEYTKKNRSTSDIAKELKTYPNTIRRILINNDIDLRSHSEAQKNQIKKNGHPMKGKIRTKEEKEKISDGMRKHWDSMSNSEKEKEKKRRSKISKDMWKNISDEKKESMLENMRKKNLETRNAGSKSENLLADMLREMGYAVEQRTNRFTPGNQFEIDICLPKEAVAIEVDGATHFRAIYGGDRLKKTKRNDSDKNSILLGAGFTVIRVQDNSNKHSRSVCVRARDKIVKIISKSNSKGKLHKINMV